MAGWVCFELGSVGLPWPVARSKRSRPDNAPPTVYIVLRNSHEWLWHCGGLSACLPVCLISLARVGEEPGYPPHLPLLSLISTSGPTAMTSFDGYDPTKEGAGDGIGPFDGPFFAQNMVVGDSAGATMMTHRGLADMADISGGPALAHLHHHSSSFGEYHHHPPLQQFADFRQHGDATDGTPTDPSLFDQLALAYSPLASPGGVHGLDVAGAGHLLPDDGHPPHPSSSLALTQPSPWPETSPATHAWIADTIYRSGMSSAQQPKKKKTRRHAIHIQPNIFRTVKKGDSRSPGSIGSRLPGVAGETPFAWFRRAGMSPRNKPPPGQPSCSIDSSAGRPDIAHVQPRRLRRNRPCDHMGSRTRRC